MTSAKIVTPELVIAAYHAGAFPMGEPETGEIHWYQPHPRAIFDLENFHVPRRLAKTMRQGKFRFTVNRAFERVVRACARDRESDEVWITPEIVRLYCELHRRALAHSVEVWQDDRLAGGLYGVALGGAFMGESMFHVVRDASKAALVHLVQIMKHQGFVLLDTQFPTPHLAQFGLLLIPHREYMRRLRAALELKSVRFAPQSGRND